MLLNSVCGLVWFTWGTSQGEDKLGTRDKILNTKVRAGHAPGARREHSPGNQANQGTGWFRSWGVGLNQQHGFLVEFGRARCVEMVVGRWLCLGQFCRRDLLFPLFCSLPSPSPLCAPSLMHLWI